jgi:hypothetical protein
VTEIIETPSGLWIKSTAPSRSVFVWRSLDGYEQLKGLVGTWRPIEPVSALTAFLRNRQEHFRQLPLDPTTNTALSMDPSLADELLTVRDASSEKAI